MQSHLFDYTDYKAYINDRLDAKDSPRGSRSKLAQTLNCQSAYVSSVLRGSSHFTPEQGEAVNQHFLHTEDESDFFLILLQHNRAGTRELRLRLQKQLNKLSETRFDLKKKLAVKAHLSATDQSIYYSEWYYVAIHALLSVPGHSTIQAISTKLSLPATLVADALQFLVQSGLVEQTTSGFKVKTYQIHLGGESPFIAKHHANWRLQSVHRLAQRKKTDLHYSSVVSLSKKDAALITDQFIEAIKKSKAVVCDSKEEELRCVVVDFFEI